MASKAIEERELISLMNCINKTKKSDKDHITIQFAKQLAVIALGEIRRGGNPEATLVDGILKAKRQYCPELFDQQAQPAAQPVAQPVQQAPQIDQDLLLRKYKLMVQIYNLREAIAEGSKFTSTLGKLHIKVKEENLADLEKKLEEYGGQLTEQEIKYVESLPNLQEKLNKVSITKRSGTGKQRRRRCKTCGLFK
jgi:hypothetical protein